MINFSDPQTRYLIDYANLKQGLIKHQNDFLSKDSIKSFLKKRYLGCPLVLPLGIKFFNYPNLKNSFKISKREARKYIFKCKSNNYIGMKIFFKYGDKFYNGAKLKKKYRKDLNLIIKENKKLISTIKKIKIKKKVSSFQTRNIPHFGHEKIIQKLISKNKILIINPLIGMKKKGDCKNDVLKKIFQFLIQTKFYKSKVLYGPVICNMNYAGPREAFHHSYVREKLGFNEFAIGRDHAGAEDNYGPTEAAKYIDKYKKYLKIKIVSHQGAYYCRKCLKIVIKGDCKHNKLDNISGSEFRKYIIHKKKFALANDELQKHIYKIKKNLFY